jgi:hypothetical protein
MWDAVQNVLHFARKKIKVFTSAQKTALLVLETWRCEEILSILLKKQSRYTPHRRLGGEEV